MSGGRAQGVALGLALSLVAGCAAPASVDVEVAVGEVGVDALVLRAYTGSPPAAEPRITCTFPAGEPAAYGCALEGGSGRWDGGEAPLDFVLYGRPSTSVRVEVEAQRWLGDRLGTVSSTSARFELPESAGARRSVTLRLPPRTAVRRACAPLLLSSDATDYQNERSGVVLGRRTGDGRRELVATTGGQLALLEWRREGEACGLAERLSLALPNCRIWDNALVAARDGPDERSIVAGLCANPIAPEETRLIAVVGPLDQTSTARVVTLTGLLRPDVSRPALADLDGDGRMEVYALAAKDGLKLVRWDPWVLDAPAEQLPLTGLIGYRGGALNGPLVVPLAANGGRDVLVVAGYPGGIGVVDGAPPAFTLVRAEPRTLVAALSPAASVRELGTDAELTLATLYQDIGVRFTSIAVRPAAAGKAGYAEASNFDVPLPPGVTLVTDPNVRLVFGDLAGTGERSAVALIDGRAVVFPARAGASASAFPVDDGVPSPGFDGVGATLLANVDGRPGVELIGFQPTSASLVGVDGRGARLGGWPLRVQGEGLLRALVAELDAPGTAPGLAELEVVLMVRRTVQVLQLGAGTYDPEATPWPSIFHDSRAAGVVGASDHDPSAP